MPSLTTPIAVQFWTCMLKKGKSYVCEKSAKLQVVGPLDRRKFFPCKNILRNYWVETICEILARSLQDF